MARIRTIKPEMWEDEKIARLPLQANLLLIGLLNFADDSGVIKDAPLWIKSKVFPLREDVRKQDISQWIESLVKARFLVPFAYGNEGYYVIRTFQNHQLIDKRFLRYVVPPETALEALKTNHSVNTTCPPRDHADGIGIGIGIGSGSGSVITRARDKISPHFFYESEIFDLEKFKTAFVKSKYEGCNLEFYHETINNWAKSKSPPPKKNDWLATARNFMLRDFKEGKMVMQNSKKNINGKPTYSQDKSGTSTTIADTLIREMGLTPRPTG